MIGHGVSSRSSHSDAAGRTTPSAKPWTHSRMSFWSWLSSSENSGVWAGAAAAVSVIVTNSVTNVYTPGHTMSPAAVRAKTSRENDIVVATRVLFEAPGAQEAVIDDVARTVGISKALIYRHVGSKEELFVLVLINYLAELRGRYVPIDKRVDPVA